MEKGVPGKPSEILFPGRVTEVIDPHYFWMLMGSAEQVACFLKIQKDMQLYCEAHWCGVTDADSLRVGQLVIVDTGQTETRWRRGQVTRVSSESADIFYIDYGNTEVATLDKLCVDFPPIVKSVPPMAIRCCLAGVQPIAKSWTSRGIKAFTKLTVGVTLQTLVILVDVGYLLVSLYGRDSANPRSVSHQLLDEDVALPIENNEVPEFVSEIPAFMALLSATPTDASLSYEDQAGKDQNYVAGTSPPSKSSEKYVPPGRKQSGSSPGSATRNGPVHDFFPFENVSTYPPTPTDSPTKGSSIGKGSSPGSSEGSYFSRSPGRDYTKPDFERGDNSFGSPGRTENDYRRDYNNSSQYDRSPQKAFQASASPRGVSKVDTAFREPGIGPGTSKSADLGTSPRPYNTPSSGPVVNKLQNGNVHTFIPPFFQPKQPYNDVTQMNFSKPPSHISLTPPTAYEHSGLEPLSGNTALTPPGYYEFHVSPRDGHNQRYSDVNNGYPSNLEQESSRNCNNNSGSLSVESLGKTYSGSHTSCSDTRMENKDADRERYSHVPRPNQSPNSYAEEKTKGNPSIRLQIPDTTITPTSTPLKKVGQHQTDIRDTSGSTPLKSPGSYYPSKMPPISPESPAIANFDMNDIEHTVDVSTAGLHQRSYQQKLLALQEEAEDIARESKEQMQLVNMSRIGGSMSENYGDDYHETISPDVFDKISEEIRDASSKDSKQFLEEMKRSPVKRRQHSKQSDKPSKLEEVPQTYLADIDFSVAVKEALESSKTEGMENTKALLEEIVESLKAARVEKQLYDVILLLLAKAIDDYNRYHVVVMDTIRKLNTEFDIKDTLTKALKKQQEIKVRVGVSTETATDFSRMMAHVYNMSLDWRDSNSTIQDSILNTIERWIVFNNKGTQSGQTEKENLFLDCFTAFWEVSGDQLRKHNHTVYNRLKEEVKKKLLNENVNRCIRERLLCILLEMFAVAESQPSTDMFTQTPRRTMIPSSCQVKPVVCEKGTMTEDDEDQLYHDLTFSPDNRYPKRTESVTPEISLRPAKSWAQEFHSTPTEDHSAYRGDKSSPKAPSTTQYFENSYLENSYSIYETPDESFAEKPSPVVNISSGGSNVLKSHNPSKPRIDSRGQKEAFEEKQDGKPRSWASIASTDKVKDSEVKESSAKANIVDWFDYNPEPTVAQTVIPKTDRSKKSNKSKGSKPSSSLVDIAKEFVSDTNMKSDISHSTLATDISNVKSSQDAKDVKQRIDSPKSNKLRHNSPKHHESVAEKLAKSSELDHRYEQGSAAANYVTELADKQNEDSELLVIDTEGHTLPHKAKGDVNTIGKVGEGSAVKETGQKLDWWEESDQNKLVGAGEDMVPAEEMISSNRNDEFGFENEFDYADQWETESDSDTDTGHVTAASQKDSNYDNDFPTTDMRETVKPSADYGASSKVVNSDNDKDSSDLDLASYFKPVSQPRVQEPAARWVPGVRRCTLCGDKDHTSNDCPESASKLFL